MSFTFFAVSGSFKGMSIKMGTPYIEIAEADLKNQITKNFPKSNFARKEWIIVPQYVIDMLEEV